MVSGHNTEERTASVQECPLKREQLVAYGVLATSSDYCSISKTAALALSAATVVLFNSLILGKSTCLSLSVSVAVNT